MKHSVIALFDNAATAQTAAEAMLAHGFDRSAVHFAGPADAMAQIEPLPAAAAIEGGPAQGLLHRLSVLFGIEEPHVAHYQEAVSRGGIVVKVDAADEARAAVARDALLGLGAVNIDDRVGEWQQTGWTSSSMPSSGTAARTVMSAGSESSADPREVSVHQQEVSSGGVRVYRQP